MLTHQYSPYRYRIYAFLIDYVLFIVLALVMKQLFVNNDFLTKLFEFFIINLIFYTYLCLFEYSKFQATFGKRIFKIKITTDSGIKPSLKKICIRNFFKLYTVIWFSILIFNFEIITQNCWLALFFAVSTNPLWHDILIYIGGEHHRHHFIHDDVAKTIAVRG
jgi:uncharacterized RDD family membrane protein YckC